VLFDNEFFYVIAGGKAGESPANVSLLFDGTKGRHVAGVIVLGVGIWYLGFGTRWISWYRGADDGAAPKDSTNHTITGIQV